MSVLVHSDNGKEKLFIAGQARQDQVHPSEDPALTCVELFYSSNDAGLNRASSANISTRTAEKRFLNGDLYVGLWKGSLPDGIGNYLWSDGCMYEGEWSKGKKTGRGRFSWPSGATYEGDFMGGYMHGVGTYTGVDGIIYKGDWSMNVKHGLGRMRYLNGDVYQGSWKHGSRDGPGRYIWKNGNMYVGDWKGGLMCGKGTLTWMTKDSFKGQWLDGLEHGHGSYTWADGASYVGTWSRGLKDGRGTFYPAGTKCPENLGLRRGLSVGSNVDGFIRRQKSHGLGRALSSGGDQITVYNSHQSSKSTHLERYWSLEKSFERLLGLDSRSPFQVAEKPILEDNTCKKYAITLPIVEREYVQGVLITEFVRDDLMTLSSSKCLRHKHRRHVREFKRPGETIIKGHRSYDLMLTLQLGIRYSVGKITPEPKRKIGPADFGPRARIWMNFPREGSQSTPCHQSVDFKWKDYCPMVFRYLRELFKIDAADYMISICGNDALRELCSPGKSGSIFFLSNDDRFMIKTLRMTEVKVLLKMLRVYYNHVQTYENTLITKFFGLHCVKLVGGQKVRFVVMGNMFYTELRIHRRYDLKGSLQGRSIDKIEIDETTTLKDLDLNFLFVLERSWREVFLKQIELDCSFLESQRIMDYSLLLGVHFRAPQYPKLDAERGLPESAGTYANDALSIEDWAYPRGLVLVTHEPKEGGSLGSHIRGSPLKAAAAGDEQVDLLLPGVARLQIQLGVNMPARADRRVPQGLMDTNPSSEMFVEVYDVVLYFGIIDVLQEYNVAKRIEHAYKSLQFDSGSISVVDPHLYSQRFQEFLQKIFPASPY